MPEIKFYKSRWKGIRLMFLCSLFVAAGILMLNQADSPKLIAWLAILFFGLGYPAGLYQLFDRRPQIIINELGIFDRTTHHDFINWEIIQDAYISEVHKQTFICLVVNEEFEPSRKKGKFRQTVAELNKELGFQELNLSLSYVGIDATRLLHFILVARTAERPQRETLLQQLAASV
ncbi:hypothetical protein GO988_19640 [Hymenobacter sp. HMF4947]|uniref:Uncharacterized protein n=1 Tax=Hymenobacter ginkgonis TaxID=2682976 RepID=A0A7K1TJG9_9BACT|nr:STM3941 family protein [Hymenobacter ginkgonis]MVN78550.1 hypothetical protein [Hymenobacter ginkgonis]